MQLIPQTTSSVFQPMKVLALVLIISLLLAACGGGGSSDTAAAEPAADNASSSNQAAAAEDEEAEETDSADGAQGDLHEFGLTMEQLLQNIDAAEKQIAQCMSDAGFEYVAVDSATVYKGMSADKILPGVTEEQFIAQYGLGISTLYTGAAPQLSDPNSPANIGLGEQNVAIFKNLAPADQIAYNHTLLGEYSDAPLAVAIEREDFSRTGGCTRTAVDQVFSENQRSVSYVNPKDQKIDEDPRVVAAQAKYVDCVKAAGFDLSDPSDIRPIITERLDEITGGAPVETLSADAQAKLKELQAYELEITNASFSCESEHLQPVREEVENELYAG
ncbi:MAG: hypothetical protein R3C14_13395 [Caldilineaceae bacterium]